MAGIACPVVAREGADRSTEAQLADLCFCIFDETYVVTVDAAKVLESDFELLKISLSLLPHSAESSLFQRPMFTVTIDHNIDFADIDNALEFVHRGNCFALENGGPPERQRMSRIATLFGSETLQRRCGLRFDDGEGEQSGRPSKRPRF